ncbi:MAG: gene transfer agent family protein [Paracoccaceae bacterium]
MPGSQPIRWVGGEHDFQLTIGDLRALQDQCKAGPPLILTRLTTSQWMVDDVFAVLRLGLIGGGMEKADARAMVETMAEQYGLMRLATVAQLVLGLALVGVEDDPVGEHPGVTPTTELPMEDGVSAASTDPAPLPVSPPLT